MPSEREHFNPVFLTVLPKERRAQHPYHVSIMLALVTVAGTQLILGSPATSSTVQSLPPDQVVAVNIMCVIAGLSGLYATLVPERVVKLFKWDFDATWSRLFVELACHGLLAFIWASYILTIFTAYPLLTREGALTGGVTLGGGLAFWLMVAALWRTIQILWTVKNAMSDSPSGRSPSGIIGIDTLKDARDE